MKRITATLIIMLLLFCSCNKPVAKQEEPEENEYSGGITFQEAMKEGYDPESAGDGLPDQMPEPEEYTIPKDSNITDDQRNAFFELVKEYRIDYLPYFKEGEKPTVEDTIWLIVVRFRDECVTKNDRLYIPKELANRVGKAYFNVDFELKEDLLVPTGEVNVHPMAELIGYEKETVDGKTIVTARFMKYYFESFSSLQLPEDVLRNYGPIEEAAPDIQAYYEETKKNLTIYEEWKNKIVTGQLKTIKGIDFYQEVKYYTEDGITPTEFISRNEYPFAE